MRRCLSILLSMIFVLCAFTGCARNLSSSGSFHPEGKNKLEINSFSMTDEGGLQLPAGQMTAAEIRDLADIENWKAKFSHEQGEVSRWEKDVAEWAFNPQFPRKITVKDTQGNPVVNYPVGLLKGRSIIYRAVTDIHGEAYVFAPDGSEMTIYVGDETRTNAGSAEEFTINPVAEIPKKLDLMFMVDTTGSMGDELNYLKAELKDVIRRVAAKSNGFDISTSVNFYRDKGDEYVVREFDFEHNVDKVTDNISAQSSSGGGDYPEAVDKALEAVVGKNGWREDSIKICFLVLDAPPHTENEQKGINQSLQSSIESAAKQGIRIVPLAGTGIDDMTEHLMRTFAVMTGGTYVFITGDSGIGGEHKAPDTEEEYTVEYLNECLIRIISEYCGIPYEAEKVYTPQTTENAEPEDTVETASEGV